MHFLEKEGEALGKILTDTSAEPIKLSYTMISLLVPDFSDEDRVIGRGGYGTVYLGFFSDDDDDVDDDSCSEKIAIKKLNSTSPSFNDDQFIKEVRCLKMVKHKNIVQFLGYCADTINEVMEVDEGKHVLVEAQRQRFLCFEYVPNGSLGHYINKGNFHEMDWTTRYRIIKGICEGLKYLHDNRINHLDLKPENVLLDLDMEPKITDFGVSRCFDENQTRIQTINICGTRGYMAPEIINSGDISYKSDIYSLGVIISKLSMGCSMPGTKYSNISDEHWQHMAKCVEELAQSCMHDDQHKRPKIDELLCKLDEIESEIEMVTRVYDEIESVIQMAIRVNGTSTDQEPQTINQITEPIQEPKIINRIKEPLHVHPLKLVWPLAANNSMAFSLHLTNKSIDDHFAFMFLDSGGVVSSCSILGHKGVIPPQSTWGIVLHVQLQAGEPAVVSEKQGKEMVIMRTSVVEKGFPSDDISVDMFKNKQDIELEVIFVESPQSSQPPQLYEFDHKLQLDANEGKSHGTTCTQTCPDESIRTELLDIYPFEIVYPRKPEKFCMRTIHLTNTTDDEVQFWMVPSANARYYTNQQPVPKNQQPVPNCQTGIAPPQSTLAILWKLVDEKYKSTNTESFEILMVTRTDLSQFSGIRGYPADLAELVFNAAREKGGKAHRACVFVDNNSVPDKDHHICHRSLFTKSFGEIKSMDVHPTMPLVLTGHQKFVCIWRINKQQHHVAEHAHGFKDAMDFVVNFVARMQWVLSGDKTGKVNVYTTELKLLHTFAAHSDQVISIAVHPSQPYVLTSSDDLLIKLWNWDNAWTCTREFQGHLNPPTQVVFNPNDTDSFASCSHKSDNGPGNVKIWRIDSTNPETDLYGAFGAIDWTPVKDGQYLAAVVDCTYIEIWDMEKLRRVQEIMCATKMQMVSCNQMLPIIAIGEENGYVHIVNLNTYRVEYIIPAFQLGNEMVAIGFSDIAGYKRLVLGRQNSILPVEIDLETLISKST